MVDLSAIDLIALIERHAPIRFGKAVGRDEKRARKGGPCPFCGLGNDRFAVFINEIPQHYHCGIHGNGCGAHGDAITFVREGLHIENYIEACEYLEVDPGSEYAGPRRRNVHTDEQPPCRKWMEQAERFSLECKARLWSEEGKPALHWLRARGLTDPTIEQAGLGLHLAQGYQSAKEWGTNEKVWVSRGIVIPWPVSGAIWKVNIRRSDGDIAAENARLRAQGKKENAAKYRQITGGTNGLYGVDAIRAGQPLVMVEGEFDLLAFLQATERRFAGVAIGSTANGRGQKWVEAIKQATPVLIAFDNDENRAGDNAASDWKEYVSQSIRWLPWAHDLNDMLLQGMDIQKWSDLGIDIAKARHTSLVLRSEPETEHQVVAEEEQESDESTLALLTDEPGLCSTCLDADIEREALPDDYEGTMYCAEHHPVHQEAPMETPQQPVTPPDQARPEEMPALSLEKHPVVQEIVKLFNATIHIDPPGYTIQDRARELAATQQVQQQSDFWAEIHAKMQRPPIDANGKPLCTPKAWKKKLNDNLYSWHPDEKMYAHFPGGYAGYCHMQRQKTETPIVIESTIVENAIQPETAEQISIPELTIDAICEQHGLQIGQPCEKCGCPVQRDMLGEWVCVRCWPKGYHEYADLIELHYPRRMKTLAAARRQRAKSA